jgi:hypothetical protein
MSIKSPLGRVTRSGRSVEARKPIIPELIRLPDGREFVTADLLRARTRPENYNLRRRNPQQPIAKRGNTKYGPDDHRWILTASLIDIQQRYGINETYARQLRYRAEQMRDWL